MAMFVKRDKTSTLDDTFKEAIDVDKDILSLNTNLGAEFGKDKPNTKKKFPLMISPNDENY
jgi:hypothetical protein